MGSQVGALIKIVGDYAVAHYRPGGGYDFPEGLVLEMHPRVRYMIMQNWAPSYSAFVSGRELPFPAEIPLRVNPDLPDGTWRLAVVTVEVISGGRMRAPDEASPSPRS